MRLFLTASCLAISLAALPAVAQNSAPQPQPIIDIVPDARDIAFPGVMTLEVDATDVERAIFSVQQTIPVPADARAAGRFTVLYPQWLPGNHAPRG